VGAGNGVNFGLFGPEVTEVTAVEPEAYLRARATEAADGASVPVRVTDGLAQQLPFGDDSFDAAVACQVLCSVPDQASALAEIRRVLVSGGELRFYEHVIADDPWHARWQRIAGHLTPTLFGGCHCDRDTAGAIEAAGFSFERLRRFNYRPAPAEYLVAPRILGLARPA
jgi:ubiquinone/menaquinone biosynthesis C-methylase UbiE